MDSALNKSGRPDSIKMTKVAIILTAKLYESSCPLVTEPKHLRRIISSFAFFSIGWSMPFNISAPMTIAIKVILEHHRSPVCFLSQERLLA